MFSMIRMEVSCEFTCSVTEAMKRAEWEKFHALVHQLNQQRRRNFLSYCHDQQQQQIIL